MSYSSVTLDTFADGANGVAFGDLDGDGALDLVDTAGNADEVMFFGSRQSYAEAPIAIGPGQLVDFPDSVELFDLDGDGDLDVLTTAALGDDVAWHETNATATAWSHHLIDGNEDLVRHATAGDLDGDGDLDVVAAVTGENAVHWYRNNGDRTFSTAINAAPGIAGARSVEVADIDRDGDLDIAVGENAGTTATWLRNNGARPPLFTVERPSIGTASDLPCFWEAVLDIDRDGRPDLACSSFTRRALAVLMPADAPTSQPASTFASPSAPTDLEIVDLDLDGREDILLTDRDADVVRRLVTPLPGTFPLDRPLSLDSGDFDGNGSPDLAVANEGSATVEIIFTTLQGRLPFADDFETGDAAAWTSFHPAGN